MWPGYTVRPFVPNPFGWHLRNAIVVAFFAILLFIMATTQPAGWGRFAVDIFSFFYRENVKNYTHTSAAMGLQFIRVPLLEKTMFLWWIVPF